MRIGVVAIGRNEGQRLLACLRSALRDASTVVYVDSGSTDGSPAAAREMGAHVVELDMTIPFTAARSRNAGLDRLLELDPQVELVQFVDGDCELFPGWIERAARELASLPKAAVVCGRRRERFPERSIYNTLCDIEWNTPVGQAQYCGGDALMRVAALRQVGGFDPSIIAGEEPELCVRLRAAGWTIHRIAADMTFHDADMTRFGQWWKRMVRGGHAYAEGYALHGGEPEFHRRKETWSNWVWGAALPAAVLVGTIGLAFWDWRWCWAGLLPLLLYDVLCLRVYLSGRRRGMDRAVALAYATFMVVAKFPLAIGQIMYHWNRFRGRKTRLIEYKRVQPGGQPA